MRSGGPITRDLVLVGGGHAHAIVLRRWGMRPLPGARVTLINPEPTAPYTGMLPGLVAGRYRAEDLEIDLVRLARFAGARLILDAAAGLDPVGGRVLLAGRPPVAFDVASINVGISSGGAGGGRWPAKPMGAFARKWEGFVETVASGEARPIAAVIGAGVGGIELALAMRRRLLAAAPAPEAVVVALVEREAEILPAGPGALRRRLLSALRGAGVRVVTGDTGEAAVAAFLACAAGATPPAWLADTGLALENGFIRVGADLASVSHPNIFAAGDVAAMASPRPKAGVYAVRQGPALHANLAAALSGGPLRRFRPQRDHLKLISLGDGSAVAEKWGVAIGGRWLWRIKDAIDRRFMERLADLPAMAPPAPTRGPAALGLADEEGATPLCGGCGSKVGPRTLRSALAALRPPRRGDVVAGPGDDAAVLAWGADASRRQVITSDHFRAFTLDPYLLARITANHALGDVWAMGATPQAALAAIVLPAMSEAKQGETLGEILAGFEAVLGDAGADLVGGHTSLGEELTIGLTVTGLTAGNPPVGQDGAKAGDVLILTKAIGVGTILAAEMRGLARGAWVAAALAQMGRSSGPPAMILRDVAHAMTDVTGFGLAGHLNALLERAGARAVIVLDAIPYAAGAVELARAGVRSSIWPQTSHLAATLSACDVTRADPRFELLFDPQTAGGLLAAVPTDLAPASLERLHAAGEPAWIVGGVARAAPGEASLTVRTSWTVDDG